MNLSISEKIVSSWAERNSVPLGLCAKNIKATYIWNPGGFVNQSYQITDGETKLHVKFVKEEMVSSLLQWKLVNKQLTKKYYAPKLVFDIKEEVLQGYPYGLVFEYYNGKALHTISNPLPFVQKIIPLLNKLHQDHYLKELISLNRAVTYADTFKEEYITRFKEDLDIITQGKQLLYFVKDNTIDWMQKEVDNIQEMVLSHPNFQEEATDVVHNDIGWQNVLIQQHNYCIIDWDNLTLAGDAAMDYSVFLWPLYKTTNFSYIRDYIEQIVGKNMMERMALYFRAKLLDEVIDVLADYIEAEEFPEVKQQTQKRAREIHQRAIQEYRKLYN